jgi:5-dehydro-4-deoxyglucarate dehydratase
VTALHPAELASRLGTGLLTFPVTHFDHELQFDEQRYREHLEWQTGYDLGGIFVAGGTGEGFSLSREEVSRVVATGVAQAAGRLPVIAPATGATVVAAAQAADAEAQGADGVLLLPPYLTEGTQEGLRAHVSAVLDATRLGVIVYNRANAIYSAETMEYLADRHANLIGFKDGIGDVEAMARLYARLGDRLIYVGGLPTAETFALPLLQLGFTTYSSAICNFAPDFALDFYRAVRANDRPRVYAMLNGFVLPYLAIRDRAAGYGVSIIKAGLDAVGRHGGPVRPPLQGLTETDRHDLARLLQESAALPAGV